MLFTTHRPALHAALHDAVHRVPSRIQRTRHSLRVGTLQPEDRQRLKQCCEARTGFGPRHLGLQNTVLLALNAGHLGLQQHHHQTSTTLRNYVRGAVAHVRKLLRG